MGKTRDNNLFLIATLTLLALFTVACDKNIARPEDLAALTSVSVDVLSVEGPQSIISGGEGTTLCWKVTDDDGVLQKVELATDDGSSHTVAEEDCEGINPDHSTMYSINAYVDGEIAKTKNVYIEVMDENGNAIDEAPAVSELPPSETACDDGEDEDGDDAADCDDSDCAGDDACYVEPTFAFASTGFDPQEPVVGDAVTVSWSSNFAYVTVYLNGSPETRTYAAEGTYELFASGSDTVLLKGYGADGVPVDAELSIAASIVPHTDFEGSFASFSASPSSNLIAGDSYVVSWVVEDARTAQMGSYTGLTGSTDSITATEGTTSYSLSAVDNYGNTDSRSLSVTAKGFSSLSDVMGKVSDVQPGGASGEYYFIGTGGIFHTTDTLLTTPVEEIGTGGVTGTLKTLAVDGTKMYVGTTAGVYFRDGTEGDFAEILTTGGRAEVHSIAILNDGTVLVGTDEVLYEVGSDNVLKGVKDFAGHETVADYSGSNAIDFVKIVSKSAGSSVLVIITESDGTYLSTDGGDTFALTGLNNIEGGFAKTGGNTYVWSDSKVYKYNSDSEIFEVVDDLTGVTGIHFADDAGGRTFAATAEGVVCGSDGSWFTTDLTSDTAFVLGSTSGTATVTAVTSSGEKAALSFSGMSGGRLINVNSGMIHINGAVKLNGSLRGVSF